jgi:hypothetical protein
MVLDGTDTNNTKIERVFIYNVFLVKKVTELLKLSLKNS